MSAVVTIDPLTDPRWDAFVEQHPLAWVTHTSAWANVLTASFPQLEPKYLCMVDASGIRAALPLYLVRSRLTGARLVSMPFSTLCDPLVKEPSQVTKLLEAAEGFMRSAGAHYVEVRSWRCDWLREQKGWATRSDYLFHSVDISEGEAAVEKKVHRRSVRPCIHRAQRSAVRCRPATMEIELEGFYHLYSSTRRTLGLPPMPKVFFSNMWRFLYPRYLEVLLAENVEHTVAALLLFKYGSRVSAEACGWDRDYKSERVNHRIFWEGICSSIRQGYRSFDFGRTKRDNLPVLEFKRRWGTVEAELPFSYFGNVTMDKTVPSNVIRRVARSVFSLLPPPFHRAVGRFVYRHRH